MLTLAVIPPFFLLSTLSVSGREMPKTAGAFAGVIFSGRAVGGGIGFAVRHDEKDFAVHIALAGVRRARTIPALGHILLLPSLATFFPPLFATLLPPFSFGFSVQFLVKFASSLVGGSVGNSGSGDGAILLLEPPHDLFSFGALRHCFYEGCRS
jgi:hypothetical protein